MRDWHNARAILHAKIAPVYFARRHPGLQNLAGLLYAQASSVGVL